MVLGRADQVIESCFPILHTLLTPRESQSLRAQVAYLRCTAFESTLWRVG